MTTRLIKKGVLCLFSMLLVLSVQPRTHSQQRSPNPVLVFSGAEYTVVNGKQITRYTFEVFNRDAYPAEMFAAAPSLPPCGANASASRTWVDVYDQTGKRLNGFCAIDQPKNLTGIWFGLETDTIPPSWIYIEMTDRQTGAKYKSNLAETTM